MGQVALQEPLRPLNTLAADIEAELALAYDAGIAHYTRAGELLNEAEQHFPNNRKGFFAWAERRFDRGPQQVKRYMGLANEIQKLENRRRTIKNPRRVIVRENVRVLDPRPINAKRKVPLKGRLRIARIKLAGPNEREMARSEIEESFRRKEISRNVCADMLRSILALPAPDEAAE